ncbi:hypothetical protein [Pseudomonas lini]
MNQLKSAGGTLDPAFGAEGIVALPFKDVVGSIPSAVLALPQNKLLIALSTTQPQESPSKVARLKEDGSLDGSFGQDGIVAIPFADDTWFSPRHLRPTANGGWLVIGSAKHPLRSEELAVVRQLEDGRLDATFGDNGKVLINLDELLGSKAGATTRLMTRRHDIDEKAVEGSESGGGVSVTEQADGKILLVGTVLYDFDDLQGIVMRLNQDGTLDNSFNGAGFVRVELPGFERRWNYASAVAVQEDGKVVVSGDFSHQDSSRTPSAYIIRYDQSGRVDTQFGDDRNGVVNIIQDGRALDLGSLRLLPGTNGISGIIALGVTEAGGDRRGLIVVLNPSGSFNRVFNGGKPLVSNLTDQGEMWQRSGLQKNQQGNVVAIIVSGQGGSGFLNEQSSLVTARYLLDGSLDKTFGSDGFVEFNDARAIDIFRDCVVLADNKIIVSGYVAFGPLPLPGNVLRYLG